MTKPLYHASILALLAAFCLASSVRAQSPEKLDPLPPAEIAKVEAALPAKAAARPAKPRKVLVFWRCEGFFHGDGIRFGNKAFELMGQKTGAYTTVISNDMVLFDPATLNQFDAVVFNNTTGLKFTDPTRRQALIDFVRNGKGIVGVHAAADNFYDFPEMAEAIGGLFDGHPWGGGGTWAVKIDEPAHPLNKGFKNKGFLIRDEIYQLKAPYSRKTHRVLASLDMDNPRNLNQGGMKREDLDYAISQAREYGKGRAFYCGLGHNGTVFQTPGVLEHYLDAVQFALGDLKVDVTPSAQLRVQPVAVTTVGEGGVDDPMTAIAGYEFGQSRAQLAALEEQLRDASPARLREVESRLVKLIDSPQTTFAGKQYCCRLLRRIGAGQCVPALGRLLLDSKTSDMARYALQRNPSEQADVVLLAALDKLSGQAQIGVVSTLADRSGAQSVSKLAQLAGGADKELSLAAVQALGRIGGPAAAQELSNVRASADLKDAVADARLLCADKLLAAGQKRDAMKIYRELSGPGNGKWIRIAAYRGSVMAEGEAAAPTVLALLSESDLDLQRAGGLLAREVPGSAATRQLAAKLEALPPATQVLLLSALADRGDTAATPAVTKLLAAENADVKLAAIEAMAVLGDASSVEALIAAAKGGDDAGQAARDSLLKMKAPGVDAAIVKRLNDPDAKARAMLTASLVDRGGKAAIPSFLKLARDTDDGVRREAIKGLEELSGEKDLPDLVTLLKTVEEKRERGRIEKALVAAGRRIGDPDRAAAPLLAGYPNAPAPAKASLLAALGKLGGARSVPAVRAATKDANAEVQEAAIRALCYWPDAAPLEALKELAQTAPQENLKLLALRQYVNMLQMPSERPPAQTVAKYSEALEMSKRPEEKALVLHALGQVPDIATLELVAKLLDDKDIGPQAQMAYLSIFEGLKTPDRTRWKVTASHNSAGAGAAIDDDLATRWASNGAMIPGMWFAIDLGAEQPVGQIVLDATGSNGDYPRGYEVFISPDGKNWGEPVKAGSDTKTITTIGLPPGKRAQHVKIVQTGNNGLYWSIHNLLVYAGQAAGEDKIAQAAKVAKSIVGDVKELTDKAAWKSRASLKTEDSRMAYDGDPATRWVTGAAMKSGMWYELLLSRRMRIARIELDARPSNNDYPRGYEVYVSDDPENWGAPVAIGESENNPVTKIRTAPKAGRLIRIVQTGESTGSHWSIYEMKVFASEVK